MPPKKPQLLPHNQRILQVIEEYQPISGLNKTEFWAELGINIGNASKYKAGTISFQVHEVSAFCRLTGVSADWIFGLSEQKYRKKEQDDPVKLLEAALTLLKASK